MKAIIYFLYGGAAFCTLVLSVSQPAIGSTVNITDAKRFGAEIPKGAHLTSQERAYTSPIWYTPK